MADSQADRSEKPTPKRLKDARERGQVARSRDLSAAASLVAVVIGLGWVGSHLLSAVAIRLSSGLQTLGDRPLRTVQATELGGLVLMDLQFVAWLAGPPALLAGFTSVLVSLAQTGPMYSPKALRLNWERLSPSSGLKRLAPKHAAGELAKALVGTVVIAGVGYLVIRCSGAAAWRSRSWPAATTRSSGSAGAARCA